ncbi:hypothetical protein IEQ34_017702 [Dendrobium chrysotoxum]|uniref:Uncharacterized protein n=1 Tax=Dendrobium chrysotoxum TaxID=161865 RepID=A0AAV7GDA9_DENCH|nr:hypothetical protein IEQ34_017702 [Dendrobium chrysotoxum]
MDTKDILKYLCFIGEKGKVALASTELWSSIPFSNLRCSWEKDDRVEPGLQLKNGCHLDFFLATVDCLEYLLGNHAEQYGSLLL